MGVDHPLAALSEAQAPSISHEPAHLLETTLTGAEGVKDTVRRFLSSAGLQDEVYGEMNDVEGTARAWFLQKTGDPALAAMLGEALVKSQGTDFVFLNSPEGKIFVLDKLAEQGVQGVVYRVLDTRNRLNEIRALKLLLMKGDEQDQAEAIARFTREDKILQAIAPTTIAPVSYGIENRILEGREEYFQLMEFIDGFQMKDLAVAIAALREKSRGRVKIGVERTVAAFLAQILHEESQLADYGVVHRDIKPANLILRRNGKLAMMDFGLAVADEGRPGQTRVTRTGVVAGTPAYMAPEAVELGMSKGGSATESDLFSIGATAHEFLSGKHPIQQATFQSMMLHVGEWDGDLPHLSDIEDPALESVLRALLQKEDAKRGDPLKHVLALRKAGLIPWKKSQILGAEPLAMPMPDLSKGTYDAQALAEFWAEEFKSPVMSRRAFLGSAAAVTAIVVEAKTGFVRSTINPPLDERAFREAVVREPEKPRSPYGVTYSLSRTSDGQELRTGVEEIQLRLSEQEIIRISGEIPGVRDVQGGLRAYVHGMTVDQIESLRAIFRSQNTGSSAEPRCVSAFVAPDGALVMMIPHVGLVCQDDQGRIEYVWDLQWTQAMKNTTPPPKEIESFFSYHFPSDFEAGMSAGDSLDPLRGQVPDIQKLPATWNAKDVASKNWSKVKRACKLDATKTAESEQSPPQSP